MNSATALWLPHFIVAIPPALAWLAREYGRSRQKSLDSTQKPVGPMSPSWASNLLFWLFGALTLGASSFTFYYAITTVGSYSGEPIRNDIGPDASWLSRHFFDVYVDALSCWFNLIVATVGLAASAFSVGYLRNVSERKKDLDPWGCPAFQTLFNLFLASMFLVQILDNLVMLCVAMEVTTLISTFLVCYERSKDSVEAAWKYVSICSVGIVFAFLGTLLLIYAFPVPAEVTLNLSDLQGLDSSVIIAYPEGARFLKLAFLFALLGFGTKAGIAPVHTWLPDGHAQAPTPVSALLSGVLLKSALYAILRFYGLVRRLIPDEANYASTVLLLAGLLSLMLAVPFIIKKNDFKRILAYHSLEHMGIIFFAVGVGTIPSLAAGLLHSFNHAINKALVFFLHGVVRMRYRAVRLKNERSLTEEAERTHPLLSLSPFYGGILIVAGLALVGAPPFSIFCSEFLILGAAIEERLAGGMSAGPLPIVLFVISLVLIFGGLVTHLVMWVTQPQSNERMPQRPIPAKVDWIEAISIGVPVMALFGALVAFGVCLPGGMWPLLQQAAAIVIPPAALLPAASMGVGS